MNHLTIKGGKDFFTIEYRCDILVDIQNTLKILDFFYYSFKLN